MDNAIHTRLHQFFGSSCAGERLESVQAVAEGLLFNFASTPLFFCLNPELPFVFSMRQHPSSSSTFGPVAGRLSAALSGVTLESIEKPAHERYYYFHFLGSRDQRYRLYFQVFPHNLEVLLINADEDVLYSMSQDAEPPDWDDEPARPTFYGGFSSEEIIERLREGRAIAGISPEYREHLEKLLDATPEIAEKTISSLRNCDFDLQIIAPRHENQGFQLYPVLPGFPEGGDRFDSLRETVGRWFGREARRQEIERLSRDIRGAIRNWRKRTKRTFKKLDQEEESHLQNQDVRKLGDLILANMHLVKPGRDSVIVDDLYSQEGGSIEIPLDPTLSANENAQRYYRRAAKAERAGEHIGQRRDDLEQERSEIKQITAELEVAADDLKALRKLHGRLSARDMIPSQRKQKQRQQSSRKPGRRFSHPCGARLIVGRNNRDNETVTFQIGNDLDFWLHAAGLPGSHVILRNPDKRDEPIPSHLQVAASVAAYYSKARNSANVQINWTQRRYLKKVKGGSPGQVLLKHYKSVIADPELPDQLEKDE